MRNTNDYYLKNQNELMNLQQLSAGADFSLNQGPANSEDTYKQYVLKVLDFA